jgi:hypothetical protein
MDRNGCDMDLDTATIGTITERSERLAKASENERSEQVAHPTTSIPHAGRDRDAERISYNDTAHGAPSAGHPPFTGVAASQSGPSRRATRPTFGDVLVVEELCRAEELRFGDHKISLGRPCP